MSVSDNTLAIKARVYNQIRKDLYKKVLQRDKAPDGLPTFVYTKHHKFVELTDKEKLELFDRWFILNWEAHKELNEYKKKRKKKARIFAERLKRGVKPRIRKTKEQYDLEQQLAHAIP